MRTQYYTAASLDGFIATVDDSLEWLFPLGIALARRPAFSDNSNMTRSRDGERVVSRNPSIARSWVAHNLRLLSLHYGTPIAAVCQLIG